MLLTGRHPFRVGTGPEVGGELAKEETTIAEAFKAHGYRQRAEVISTSLRNGTFRPSQNTLVSGRCRLCEANPLVESQEGEDVPPAPTKDTSVQWWASAPGVLRPTCSQPGPA
jgi:hypothetical protein